MDKFQSFFEKILFKNKIEPEIAINFGVKEGVLRGDTKIRIFAGESRARGTSRV